MNQQHQRKWKGREEEQGGRLWGGNRPRVKAGTWLLCPQETPGLLRAPRGQHGLQRFRIIPVIMLRIGKPTAPFPSAHRAPFCWLSAFRTGWVAPAAGDNARQEWPRQGLGSLWAPHVPEGDSALGISTSTGHSCSGDINGYKPALGFREGRCPAMLCAAQQRQSGRGTFPFPSRTPGMKPAS